MKKLSIILTALMCTILVCTACGKQNPIEIIGTYHKEYDQTEVAELREIANESDLDNFLAEKHGENNSIIIALDKKDMMKQEYTISDDYQSLTDDRNEIYKRK